MVFYPRNTQSTDLLTIMYQHRGDEEGEGGEGSEGDGEEVGGEGGCESSGCADGGRPARAAAAPRVAARAAVARVTATVVAERVAGGSSRGGGGGVRRRRPRALPLLSYRHLMARLFATSSIHLRLRRASWRKIIITAGEATTLIWARTLLWATRCTLPGRTS